MRSNLPTENGKFNSQTFESLPASLPAGGIVDSPQVAYHLGNMARAMAASSLVPEHYKGQPSEILIALDTARALKVPPMQFLQGTYNIKGKLGMSADLMKSLLMRSGRIVGAIDYKVEYHKETLSALGGVKNISVTAMAIEKETGRELIGPKVDLMMAINEKWTSNNKYRSMPEIMLEKRAVTFFIRKFYPDLTNGMHEVSELEDLNTVQAPAAPAAIQSSDFDFDDLPQEPNKATAKASDVPQIEDCQDAEVIIDEPEPKTEPKNEAKAEAVETEAEVVEDEKQEMPKASAPELDIDGIF